jgi:hypothetical protein
MSFSRSFPLHFGKYRQRERRAALSAAPLPTRVRARAFVLCRVSRERNWRQILYTAQFPREQMFACFATSLLSRSRRRKIIVRFFLLRNVPHKLKEHEHQHKSRAQLIIRDYIKILPRGEKQHKFFLES